MGTLGTNGVPVLGTWKFGLARAREKLRENSVYEKLASVSRSFEVPRVPNVPGGAAKIVSVNAVITT